MNTALTLRGKDYGRATRSAQSHSDGQLLRRSREWRYRVLGYGRVDPCLGGMPYAN